MGRGANPTYRGRVRQVRVPSLLGVTIALGLALAVPTAATATGPSVASGPRVTTTTTATTGTAHPQAPREHAVRLDRDTRSATGADRGVRSWPGSTIRYWADLPSSYDWSLHAALRGWNATGMHMSFVRSSKARSQLRITVGDTHGADGYATIGYQRSNWVHLRPGLVKPVFDESPSYAKIVAAHIVAHELGHVLGLGHTSGCELMTPVLQLPSCPVMADRVGYYRRIVDRAAVKKTVARYGGRVTLAPASSPIDPLPPRLRGVAFHGGYDADAPVQLTWTPPSHTPSGSHVLLLVTAGKTCTYPIAKDYWGTAVYDPARFSVLQQLSPAKGSVTPAALGITSHCYALKLVNRTGAGSSPQGKVLQSWVAAPSAPTVTSLRRAFDTVGEAGYYQVTLDYDDSHGEFVDFLARPSGHCATTWPTGESYFDHELSVSPGEPAILYAHDSSFQPIENACLTFFSVRADGTRISSATVQPAQVEPAPALPVINALTKTSPDGYTLDATYDDFVAGLAVVVSPKDSCVHSWPAGQDPTLSLVTTFVDTTGYSLPCLSFFTVNAAGQTSAAVEEQTVALTPPQPTFTGVTIDEFGDVDGHTSLIPYGPFGLAVTVGPQGSCQPFPTGTPPWDLAATLYDDGDGKGEFALYSDQAHPCLTFYAYNFDGDLGPPTTVQL